MRRFIFQVLMVDVIVLFHEGVTEYCGTVKGSINYLMCEGNLDFQITDQSMAYFGQRLSLAITG